MAAWLPRLANPGRTPLPPSQRAASLSCGAAVLDRPEVLPARGLEESSVVRPDTSSTAERPAETSAKKAVRHARKQQGCLGATDSVQPQPSRKQQGGFEIIDGVGPKAAEKLRTIGGYHDTYHLQREYFTIFHANHDKMVAHLKDTVGLRTRSQCEAVVHWLAAGKSQSDSRRLAQEAARAEGVSLCIEGNISAGKSTFLRLIGEELRKPDYMLHECVEIVPEPVDKWQNLGQGENSNILDAYYKDPERYAYTFQNYVFLTRTIQEAGARNYASHETGLRLLERSVWSDRMVFVRAVHKSKYMSELELNVYNSWFDPMVQDVLPGLVPDGFIYLRALPEQCKARMQLRGRQEEEGVDLSYLDQLHDMHEQWLHQAPSWGSRLVRQEQDALVHMPPMPEFSVNRLPDSLKGKVRQLSVQDNGQLHRRLDNLPALELDCSGSVDILNDRDARSEFAQQVTDFRKWVKDQRAFRDRAAQQLLDAVAGSAGGLRQQARQMAAVY